MSDMEEYEKHRLIAIGKKLFKLNGVLIEYLDSTEKAALSDGLFDLIQSLQFQISNTAETIEHKIGFTEFTKQS